MSDVGQIRRIPHFIVAATLRELQRRMLLTNVRDGMEYRWFDIQFDSSQNLWTAFYYRKIETNTETIEILAPEAE